MFYVIISLLCICYLSFFEWCLHRFVMHQKFLRFSYAFLAHAGTHHGKFRSDQTYHLHTHPHDRKTITMAWWNGGVLVAIVTLTSIPACIMLSNWWIALIMCLCTASYYAAYEYSHWCMHLPKKRKMETFFLFRWLNGHHLLHHRYPKRNFNVVLPLADLCLRTLLIRSPISFKQATGPSIPCVQPKKRELIARF